MKASVEAICYKVRPLKNGEYPLMLRITKSRKRRYLSLGVSVNEKFWDFDKTKPKRNCPNKEALDKLIAAKVNEFNGLIVEMTADQREYTPETLVQSLHGKVRFKTVIELYNSHLADLRKAGRLGNAAVYKYSRDSLLTFTSQRLDIPFSDIDAIWLKRYETWLRDRGGKDTTISQLFRSLTCCNDVIKNKERGLLPSPVFLRVNT